MIKKILLIIIFLMIAAVAALIIFIDPIVKYSVNTYGPAVLNTNVYLDHAGISFKEGAIELKGVKFGDKKIGELNADRIFVDVQPTSILGEVFKIDNITIDGVKFDYTIGGASNIAGLLENAKKNKKAEAEKPASAKTGKDPLERKIYIKNLEFVNSSVSVAGGDKKFEVPFPDLRVKEIGNETTGVTVIDASVQILTQVSLEVAKAAQKSATDAIKQGLQEGKSLSETIGGFFGK